MNPPPAKAGGVTRISPHSIHPRAKALGVLAKFVKEELVKGRVYDGEGIRGLSRERGGWIRDILGGRVQLLGLMVKEPCITVSLSEGGATIYIPLEDTVRGLGMAMKIRIENVVATTSVGVELDLKVIALALDGAEYEPEQFPGIVYRIKEPKTATLLFRSGKLVCTGAKSIDDVHTAIKTVIQRVSEAGIRVTKDPKIEVQNIVASSDLQTDLNLNAIAISLGLDRVEYEPEQFPGLVYRIDVPKVVALLFGSGKIVCTGAKKTEDIKVAVQKIYDELNTAGLLKRA